MSSVVLLGPQRFQPTVREVVRSLGSEGPIAIVTAGWQERESEDREFEVHVERKAVDLMLYHRADDVLLRDADLAAALREHQELVQEIQTLYRVRLDYALEAARDLLRRPGKGRVLIEQRRAAIQAVRTLDRQHLRRIRQVRDAFEARWRPAERPAVARHRKQLEKIIEDCGLLAVAGGHVAVLLNRLRLFDPYPMLGGRPVIAWSAGAMAVSERVILFHDRPPQGAGNAEIFDTGLGWCRDVVALPDARHRLQLEDPVRVELFARRFGPAMCAVLEGEARLDWNGEVWTPGGGVKALGRTGKVRNIRAAT
jgi:hypothetical protein